LVSAGYGMKLTVRDLALVIIEVRGHHTDTPGIANKYHFIRQLLGEQMQVEYTAITIDNKL